MNIQQLWNELESDTRADQLPGYFRRRIRDDSTLDLNLAVEKPSNRRLLLFRIATQSIDASTKLPSCQGFELQRIALPADDPQHTTLLLTVTDTRFRDVFTSLVSDILQRMLAAKNERESVSMMLSRLQQWQTFFKKITPDGLSDEAQRGLFGELFMLRLLITNDRIAENQLSFWTGPLGANQDFQFGTCAVEVKVTLGPQDQRLHVSNERQLDTTGLGMLFIQHHSLDMRAGAGETLNGLVADIRRLLQDQPANREQFETLLFAAGYLDAQANLYHDRGYTHRELNYFQVTEDFPRIVEGDLKPGVGSVSYKISVSQCRPFTVTETAVMSSIKERHD